MNMQKLNKDHEDLNMNERIYKIEEIKQILAVILKNMLVYNVILFGSYAKIRNIYH